MAEEYIYHKAFKEPIEHLNTFSMSGSLPGYTPPANEAAWTEIPENQNILDEVVYTVLDVTGFALGFVGLDVITDGLGFIYSNARGNQTDSYSYGASIFILGVPTAVTKKISKEVLENSAQMIIRKNGDEILVEVFDEALHGTRSKYKLNGSLTNEEVLKVKELEEAGKITQDQGKNLVDYADDAVKQRKLLAELEVDFSFLDDLGWYESLKDAFKADIFSTPQLKTLFEESIEVEKKNFAEAWEIISSGPQTIRTNPENLEKLYQKALIQVVDEVKKYKAKFVLDIDSVLGGMQKAITRECNDINNIGIYLSFNAMNLTRLK